MERLQAEDRGAKLRCTYRAGAANGIPRLPAKSKLVHPDRLVSDATFLRETP
jgi:hypothetical protein